MALKAEKKFFLHELDVVNLHTTVCPGYVDK